MKHVIGILYLSTAVMGFYWAIYLTLMGLYGIPFSAWYVIVFVGATLLLGGAILWWWSVSEWRLWVPIVGSACLAAYFIPAVIVVAWQGRLDLLRVFIAALVLATLIVAIKARQTGLHQLSR
ncbi:MAG: hypothetical protein J0L64_03980 [Acidobacteria bacterium]|nr:hypothetical protein [Acidobacteriota bacterium]